MKFSVGQLALASCVAALPAELARRAAVTDIDILNYALTLEHLEDAFYKEGLKKFSADDFTKAGYLPRLRTNVGELGRDESTHVSFLTTVIKSLNAKPVAACTYDFGLTNVESFIDLAGVLEAVGVTAYLGAAALISDKDYLTPAASILTVEARHQAYLSDNRLPGPRSPFPQPFDSPQGLDEVYSLASQFIVKCPKSNPSLPVTAFPLLTNMEPGVVRAGDVVTFKAAKAAKLGKNVFASFAFVTGPVFAPVTVGKNNMVKITIPKGVAGISYVVLSSSKNVTSSTILAGPSIIMVQAPYTIGGFPSK